MDAPGGRPLLLCVESDPCVRRALGTAGRDLFRFHFVESLYDPVLLRRWTGRAPAARVALVEVPDTRVGTLARLSRLRERNPGLRVVLTACYDGDYQLAAERLRELSERVVFRPFDVEPVVRTLFGLARSGAAR